MEHAHERIGLLEEGMYRLHPIVRLELMKAQRFISWLTWKRPTDLWLEQLQNAHTYEEWVEAASQLDALLGNDLWFVLLLLCFYSLASPYTIMMAR